MGSGDEGEGTRIFRGLACLATNLPSRLAGPTAERFCALTAGAGDKDANVREQDRFLPIANISRIMKRALPGNAKIAKDAKETVQECVSEFISFITSE